MLEIQSDMTVTVQSKLTDASNWWNNVNKSPLCQDQIFHALAALYAIVAAAALIQLIRIHSRVPEYGWTTQKVFHLLNFAITGVRATVFVFRPHVHTLQPPILQRALLETPSLALFTTYSLLVLFWADVYYQAREVSTHWLRPGFLAINAAVYVIQFALWCAAWWNPVDRAIVVLCRLFFAGVSLLVALGFVLFGVRIVLMLHWLPIVSKGREKKLREVGYVTTICCLCFLMRCAMVCVFDGVGDLDHPILNLVYYLLVEILPVSLVLFVLRKVPRKREITQYHQIC